MRQAKNGARIRRFTLNEFLRLFAMFNPSSPAQSSETDKGGDPQRRHNKSTADENQASSNVFIMVLESLIYASLDICEYSKNPHTRILIFGAQADWVLICRVF